MSERPKALYAGTLFDGLLDCYVLDDERRVVSSNGAVRALTSGARERGDLGAYLAALPSRFADLALRANIEFTTKNGRVAQGRDAAFLVDLCRAYAEALGAGELRANQMHLGARSAVLLAAFAKVGVIALIDEATGYEKEREAAALSFAFRAILLESAAPWNLMWPAEFVEAVCKLHGERWDRGAQPRFLASTYEKLYALILGEEVCAGLKKRNPDPHFGTNHHQWLTPEAREVVRRQIPLLIEHANTCRDKEEFWARVEHKYTGRPLQLSWLAPTRGKPEAAE